MSRLFASRVTIFGGVTANRGAPLSAVHRIVFKSLLEHVRSIDRLTPAALRHVQADVYALMAALPAHLPTADRQALNSLLDDVRIETFFF